MVSLGPLREGAVQAMDLKVGDLIWWEGLVQRVASIGIGRLDVGFDLVEPLDRQQKVLREQFDPNMVLDRSQRRGRRRAELLRRIRPRRLRGLVVPGLPDVRLSPQRGCRRRQRVPRAAQRLPRVR